MNHNTSSLSIGLLENCCHSLKRGYELWNQGNSRKDSWLLKEAVFWVHHGIELALKQLLVQTNEYLVFDRLDEAINQLSKLRKSSNINFNKGALDLFEEDKPAFSVGFEKLLKRAAIMLELTELEEESDLRKRIDNLTLYRNKIVHFSVKINSTEVATLLYEILEPLLELLERKITDDSFVNNCITEIREKADPLKKSVYDYITRSEDRIIQIIRLFNGQTVPGSLFNLDIDRIVLPRFTTINKNNTYSTNTPQADIIAVTPSEEWWIEINLITFRDSLVLNKIFEIFKKNESLIQDKRVIMWLIVLDEIKAITLNRAKQIIQEKNQSSHIFISSLDEIVNLEQLLQK